MELRNDFNYTVIIPHKNCSDLLQRCLDSIPYREDIQVIVVDDNSDASKVDFDRFPGLDKPNVEVYFTKEGKGAGYARNVGLKHARGKWLLFVDADDFLAPDVLAKIDPFVNSQADVVYFRLAEEKDLDILPVELRGIVDVVRGKAYSLIVDAHNKTLAVDHYIPVGKIVCRDCVERNHIRFDEIPCSNDVMFFTRLAMHVRTVEVSDSCIYYISAPTSRNLTARKDFESGKTRLHVCLERNRLLQENGYGHKITPPLIFLYQFRSVGFIGLCHYCAMVIKSTTPLFTGFSKFVGNPKKYLSGR